ncbi:MAG: hypothetical protein QF911_02905 [Candidatus Thalassarchaeaceae archaeon]|jgi:hypothetical protein|nr:hypothetical protein [Candidatus Thalassarchaeaceae archaeon]
MVELDDNVRLGLLVGAAALLVFELLNMPGMLGGGEKLFLIDLVGLGSDTAFRADTGFSTQDIVGFLAIAVMAVLYFVSKEDDLDWEALLGDDDEEE